MLHFSAHRVFRYARTPLRARAWDTSAGLNPEAGILQYSQDMSKPPLLYSTNILPFAPRFWLGGVVKWYETSFSVFSHLPFFSYLLLITGASKKSQSELPDQHRLRKLIGQPRLYLSISSSMLGASWPVKPPGRTPRGSRVLRAVKRQLQLPQWNTAPLMVHPYLGWLAHI